MASALPPDGRITTCDVDPEATAIARRYMDESGHGDKIEIKLGPALETIQTPEGPFDIVFIDADKPNYQAYYEAVLPLLADDGLVIADNVLWSGRVVEPDGDESTQAIKAFNELNLKGTTVLIDKVQVIAMGDTPLAAPKKADAEDGAQQAPSFLVTVAVTPDQSIKLAHGINEYTLYAGLRGPDVKVNPDGHTDDMQIFNYDVNALLRQVRQ